MTPKKKKEIKYFPYTINMSIHVFIIVSNNLSFADGLKDSWWFVTKNKARLTGRLQGFPFTFTQRLGGKWSSWGQLVSDKQNLKNMCWDSFRNVWDRFPRLSQKPKQKKATKMGVG